MLELILLFIFNVVDYIQTVYAVEVIKIGRELNPVMNYLLKTNIAWILKLVVVPILLALTYWAIKQLPAAIWVVRAVLLWYLLVILNNCYNLLI